LGGLGDQFLTFLGRDWVHHGKVIGNDENGLTGIPQIPAISFAFSSAKSLKSLLFSE
jgi:hypothetical protein